MITDKQEFQSTHILTVTHSDGRVETVEVMRLLLHRGRTWVSAYTREAWDADGFPPWISKLTSAPGQPRSWKWCPRGEPDFEGVVVAQPLQPEPEIRYVTARFEVTDLSPNEVRRFVERLEEIADMFNCGSLFTYEPGLSG